MRPTSFASSSTVVWGLRARRVALAGVVACVALACSAGAAAPSHPADEPSAGTGPVGSGGSIGSGGTGSGAVGTAGTGTAGGGSTPLTLGPVPRDINGVQYGVFEFGGTYFEMSPSHGGRITALKQGGVDLLTASNVDPINFGSTFWSSPQSAWVWPPLAEIDSNAYMAMQVGNVVTLTSTPTTNANVKISVVKKFTPDLIKEGVLIEYTVKNEGAAPQTLAPWEISRVFPGGITFYSGASAPVQHGTFPLLPTQDVGGVTWYKHDPTVATQYKLFADGAGGWLAHLAGDIVFVKSFADVPAAQQLPNEAEIEIYSNQKYVEIEPQGPSATLAPGATLTWSVKWYVRKLPSPSMAALGNPDLVNFVKSLIQ
jgi:hypothetical protein